MLLPEDDFLLLSIVNTKLRDGYSSLEDLCASESLDKDSIIKRLQNIGYAYDVARNAFTAV